jgi:putative cell wall-binding protein
MQQQAARSWALKACVLVLVLFFALPGIASAISRDLVIERGRVWVDAKVPYSQSRYATVDGKLIAQEDTQASSKGYRTDCSGFASLCYDLRRLDGTPLSLDTASLPLRMDMITKDALLPGDLILRPKNPAAGISGHAVVFVRWTDATRTKYVGMHQSSSAKGAVEAVITYPFFNDKGFEPYRFKAIEDDFTDCQTRISGANRYATAAAASLAAFPATADTVVLASGQNWPDALGGAALAGAVNGPVLLTAKDRLPAETLAEIRRLKPSRVFILGGEASVSGSVADEVGAVPAGVIRLGGKDRYETASLVAARVAEEAELSGRKVEEVYVASGKNFPDALAAAPVSRARLRPILLTQPDELNAATFSALSELKPSRAWILGGEAAVDTTVSASIAENTRVSRLAGSDRYGTAVQVARHGVSSGLSWSNAGLASGADFPDALAGGASQGADSSVLLLAHPLRLPSATATEVRTQVSFIGTMRVYGGTGTVTYPVRRDLADILRMAP